MDAKTERENSLINNIFFLFIYKEQTCPYTKYEKYEKSVKYSSKPLHTFWSTNSQLLVLCPHVNADFLTKLESCSK